MKIRTFFGGNHSYALIIIRYIRALITVYHIQKESSNNIIVFLVLRFYGFFDSSFTSMIGEYSTTVHRAVQK